MVSPIFQFPRGLTNYDLVNGLVTVDIFQFPRGLTLIDVTKLDQEQRKLSIP